MAVEIEPRVRQLNEEESTAFFEANVEELLDISAAAFLQRWNQGEYDEVADDPDHRDVLYLALLGTGGR